MITRSGKKEEDDGVMTTMTMMKIEEDRMEVGPFSTEEESPTASARLLAQKEELCRTLHGKLAQVRSLCYFSPSVFPLWLALDFLSTLKKGWQVAGSSSMRQYVDDSWFPSRLGWNM